MTSVKPILVLTAILEEHKIVKRLISNPKTSKGSAQGQVTGLIAEIPIEAAFSSMGMTAARKAAEELIDPVKYSGVLVTGYCGGLSIPLKVADVVIPPRIMAEAPKALKFEMDLGLIEQLGVAVVSKGYKYRAVPLITVPKVIETPENKELLLRDTKAEAVDMETAMVINVCRERGLPVVSLKIVIDDCEQKLPEFNAHFEKTGRMDHLSVAGAFVSHPMLAIQLSKNMKRASLVLQDILPEVIKILAKAFQGVPAASRSGQTRL